VLRRYRAQRFRTTPNLSISDNSISTGRALIQRFLHLRPTPGIVSLDLDRILRSMVFCRFVRHGMLKFGKHLC